MRTNEPSADFLAGMLSPLVVPLAAAMVFPLILLRAYVCVRLWDWYAVPAFGVPRLRLISAVGLSLLLTAATARSEEPVEHQHSIWKRILLLAAVLLVFLLCGWLGTFFT